MTTLDALHYIVLGCVMGVWPLVRVVRPLDPRWCHGCDRRDGAHGVGCEVSDETADYN